MVADTSTSILIFLTSTVKFAYSAIAVTGSQMGWTGMVSNVLGGITGILVFTYFAVPFRRWLVVHFPVYMNKRFSPSARMIVWLRQRYGLAGIAFLTPVLFSIPVGVMMAQSLHRDKRYVVLSMVLSCLFWAMVIFMPYYSIGQELSHWLG